MPKTVGDVIRRALGKLGVDVDEGVQPDDMALGLDVLQSTLEDMIENGIFGRLTEKLATTSLTAEEGQRIRAADGVTITLPTTVDGDCGDRAPRPYAVVIVVQDGEPQISLYSANIGDWVSLTDLAAADAFPLPLGVESAAAILAMELAPDFGGVAALSPDVIRQAKNGRTKLSLRLGSAAEPTEGVYF